MCVVHQSVLPNSGQLALLIQLIDSFVSNFLAVGLIKDYLVLYFFISFQLSDAKKNMKSRLNNRVPLTSMKRYLLKLI